MTFELVDYSEIPWAERPFDWGARSLDQTNLDCAELSVRGMNAIKYYNDFVRNELKTFGDVRALKDWAILGIPNCGRKTLNEFREVIGPYNPLAVTSSVSAQEKAANFDAELSELISKFSGKLNELTELADLIKRKAFPNASP